LFCPYQIRYFPIKVFITTEFEYHCGTIGITHHTLEYGSNPKCFSRSFGKSFGTQSVSLAPNLCTYCVPAYRISIVKLPRETFETSDDFMNVSLSTRIRILGPFLTAMTFDRIQVEHYMTKFSFLTAFFSVCVSAAKTP